MRTGIAADHGGFELKRTLAEALRADGHEVMDFGADVLDDADDYPDYGAALARAVASGTVERGIALCGSGVGICIAANKIPGARACLIADSFSAHQGVEDDSMNIMCLGSRVTGPMQALELCRIFLAARFSGAERHARRLGKVNALEAGWTEALGGN
ncbi:MAG: ribose 5-phosphate isomerase [Desulfovibrionaceae bacterium]|nr:MAG: ribose 5-phosphate isomerase [Desulfovibrionaceae bacterium]